MADSEQRQPQEAAAAAAGGCGSSSRGAERRCGECSATGDAHPSKHRSPTSQQRDVPEPQMPASPPVQQPVAVSAPTPRRHRDFVLPRTDAASFRNHRSPCRKSPRRRGNCRPWKCPSRCSRSVAKCRSARSSLRRSMCAFPKWRSARFLSRCRSAPVRRAATSAQPSCAANSEVARRIPRLRTRDVPLPRPAPTSQSPAAASTQPAAAAATSTQPASAATPTAAPSTSRPGGTAPAAARRPGRGRSRSRRRAASPRLRKATIGAIHSRSYPAGNAASRPASTTPKAARVSPIRPVEHRPAAGHAGRSRSSILIVRAPGSSASPPTTSRPRSTSTGARTKRLLAEWVRKGIKKDGDSDPRYQQEASTAWCRSSRLGGGCGISDPNLNDQPADARPPPDIPFKPALQEDNGSVKPPPGG